MLPNVLIIDDDPQDIAIMRIYLHGVANVGEVVSGKLALDYVRQNPVDIILLDVSMPMMDGFKTFEELRKMEECINVPIILVTGRCDKETILSSGMMGVDGFLAKPVSKDVLTHKVLELYRVKQNKVNRKTVLMIDDDMAYLKQVNTMLQDNYNVVIINSAKLALSYLTKHIPDVIILDYQMPLYTGASLMNIIQKTTRGVLVPIIVLSGALDREVLQEFYQYSPAAILAKPVSRADIIKAIENATR